MSCRITIQHFVHILTQMLDTNTYRDRLGFYGKILFDERMICVSGTMPGSKHYHTTRHISFGRVG